MVAAGSAPVETVWPDSAGMKQPSPDREATVALWTIVVRA
jgi:hypothetical protein